MLSGLLPSEAKAEYIRRVKSLYDVCSLEGEGKDEASNSSSADKTTAGKRAPARGRDASDKSGAGDDDIGFGTRVSSMGVIDIHGW